MRTRDVDWNLKFKGQVCTDRLENNDPSILIFFCTNSTLCIRNLISIILFFFFSNKIVNSEYISLNNEFRKKKANF